MLRKLLIVWLVLVLSACAPSKDVPDFSPKQTYSLQRATQLAAQHILGSIDQQRGTLARFVSAKVTVGGVVGSGIQQHAKIAQLLQTQLTQQAPRHKRLLVVAHQPPARSVRSKYHYVVSGRVMPFVGQVDRYQLILEVRHLATNHLITTTKYLLRGHRPAAKIAHYTNNKPQALSHVVSAVSQHVFSAVVKQQNHIAKATATTVSISPVLDGYSRERLQVTHAIRQQMQQLAQKHGRLKVVPLSSSGLKRSQYVVDVFLSPDKKRGDVYALDVVARYLGDKKTVARAAAKVRGTQFSRVTAEYQDSPIYAYTRKTANAASIIARQPYQGQLMGQALLAEAGEAYSRRQYAVALQRYQQALTHVRAEDSLRAHAGIYMAHLRLGKIQQAETALDALLKQGFKGATGKLTFKILFGVNSTQFYGTPFVVRQYGLWTKKLAKFTMEGKRCMTIIGHSSKTGSMRYNLKLSKKRAQHIRSVMERDVVGSRPYLSTSGKGFLENVVGTGTDDARDALDRRVEFSLRGC